MDGSWRVAAFYHMVLEPWLAFARMNKDCFSFHRRTVIALTEDIFANPAMRNRK